MAVAPWQRGEQPLRAFSRDDRLNGDAGGVSPTERVFYRRGMGRSETEPAPVTGVAAADTFQAATPVSAALDKAGRLARDQIHRALFGDLSETPRIGHYTFLKQIGAGGMGLVCAAYDPKLDRKVALKLIHAHSSGSPEGRGRMLREAQAMARLSHPNVVQVYEVGELEDEVFVAMEYVEGDDLAAWITAEPRGWRAVRDVFVEAGRGLAAAHAAGLVHRDFKPANVLVGRDGRVRVGDFGLARALDGGAAEGDAPEAAARSGEGLSTRLTATGAFVGTPAYMAPEQFTTGASDALSDQFSFCVALYEALYGARPFVGESVASLMQAVLHQEPSPPEGAAVPAWLRALVLRGLRKAPEGRWPAMDALVEALAADPEARARSVRRWVVGASIVAASAVGFGWLAAEARERAAREEAAKIAAEAARDRADEALHLEAQRAREEATRSRDALRLSALRRFDAGARFDHVDDPTAAVALLREIEVPEQLPGWRLSAIDALEAPIARAIFPGEWDVAFTPDGEHVLTRDGSTAASLCRADGAGAPTIFGAREGAALADAKLSPDGAHAALGYDDGLVRVFALDRAGEAGAPAVAHELPGEHKVYDLEWRDDARLLRVITWESQPASGTTLVRSRFWDAQRPDDTPRSLTGAAYFIPASEVIYTRASTSPAWGPPTKATLWDLDGARRRELPDALRVLRAAPSELLVVDGDTALRRLDLDGVPIGAAFDHAALLAAGERVDWAAFTPDGRRVITTSDRDRMFVWDAGSAALLRELDVPARPDAGMLSWGSRWTVSPDSTMVARGFADRSVRVWDLDGAGAPLVLRGHLFTPQELAFSPDSRALASASAYVRAFARTEGLQRERGDFDPTIRVWSLPARRASTFPAYAERTSERDLKWISGDLWTRDGRALVIADGLTLRLLTPGGTLAAASVALPEAYGWLWGPLFTADGHYAFFEARDRWVRWDLRAPTKVDTFPIPAEVIPPTRTGRETGKGWANLSADGQLVYYVAAAGDRIAVYRMATHELVRTIELGGRFQRAELDPAGARLVTATDDGLVRVWSMVEGEAPIVAAITGKVFPQWSRDGASLLLTVSTDPKTSAGELWLWRPGVDAPTRRLEMRARLTATTMSPEGARTAILGDDNRVSLVTNAGELATLRLDPVDSDLGGLGFSPDGAWLIGRSSTAAYIWSTATGALARVLRSPEHHLSLATFDPTGTQVLLAARDGVLTVHPFDAALARTDLRERLRAATTYCTSYKRRRVDLSEPPALAWANFAACERAQGREPGDAPDEVAGG